jgi:uncharacterized ParB-like nuclease family protein
MLLAEMPQDELFGYEDITPEESFWLSQVAEDGSLPAPTVSVSRLHSKGLVEVRPREKTKKHYDPSLDQVYFLTDRGDAMFRAYQAYRARSASASASKANGVNWLRPSSWPEVMKHSDFAHDFRVLLQDHDFDAPEYDIIQIRLDDVVVPPIDDDDDRHFDSDTGEPTTAYMDGLIEAMKNGVPMPPIVVGNVDERSGKPWGWPYDGRHRLNAAKALGLKFVPAIDVTGRGEDA